MSTFTDDFERADGGLGNNWVVDGGSASIASGVAVVAGYARVRQSSLNASGRQEALCTFNLAVNGDLSVGLGIKSDSPMANYYRAFGTDTLSAPKWILYKVTANNPVELKAVVGSTLSTGAHTMRFLYNDGILTLWIDGALIWTYADSTWGANTSAGLAPWVGGGKYEDFTFYGDESVTLDVDPSPIGNFGNSTDITITGVGTAWTTGTPGSPTFTVDHGTLSNQEVTSTTTATATYTPGTFLGIATFADPSTGATCMVTVTSDTSVVFPPSGAGGLSEAVIAWLDAQAEHGGLVLADNDESTGEVEGVSLKGAFGELLIGKRKAVGEAPYADYLTAALADIYARLWGGEEWQEVSFAESGTNAVKTDLTALRDLWLTANPPTTYTVLDVLGLLGGVPLANHQDILTAIAGIVVDNSEVIDAIEAAQGDPLATIKAVLDSLFVLGGSEANYNLASVKGWIEAAQGTNTPTIRDVLNKLGTSGNTIEARIDALSDLIVTETTLQGMLDILLAAVTGGAGISIATATDDIIDAINGIPAPDLPTNLWPGLAGVTLGDAVAISNGLVVTGPMHGILVNITDAPAGAGKYVFGDVNSWQHTGGVIFCSDNGYYERAESFGLEQQILVPRTMEMAASAVLRVNSGWVGTVRPWTRTA